jgi:YYY domain-containing protein
LAGVILLSAEQQILFVISWLGVLMLLQLSVYPSLKRTFGSFAFPVSFSVSLLLFTIISWYCGLTRIPVVLSLIPFLLLLVYHIWNRHYALNELKNEWRWGLLFFVCFFLMLDVRFVNPTISFAEKFMDHAFLASVIRSPVVPPLDPWFGGSTLNVYYYLGYWLFGCLAIVSGVPSNIAFNLALPTVFALAAVNVYAIGTLFLERFRWLPLLVFFLPNPSFFYQLAQGKAMSSILWDSTRTISNTINEYPLFSFLWGDVHAHVISLFNQAFLLFLLLFAYRKWESLESRSRWILCLLCALSLGSMPLINTWDVLVYAPITLFFGVLILWKNRAELRKPASWISLVTIPPLSILAYLPFYLQLVTNAGGISLVRTPSDPLQFLLVNGLFIAIFIAVLSKEMRQHPWYLLAVLPFALAGYNAAAIAAIPLIYLILKHEKSHPDLLAILGLVILVLCELIYLRDSMGDTYFRMNTVFKCYLPAWLMLGTAAFSMVAVWLKEWGIVPSIPIRVSAIAAVTVIACLFAIPFLVSFTYNYGTGTLDGLVYLEATHPADAEAVSFLRSLSGNELIVEAEGGDYTYYSRISSFTGIPAIIGMPFHEFMWRGDKEGWFSTRNDDIRAIYEQPQKTIPLMKKYNATLLYVGDPERERYNVTLPAAGLEKIYSSRGTEIYRPSG